MSNPNKIILGLLGAAVAGIAIGMLLAPEKSNEIKQKIADSASDFASRLGDFLTKGKDKLEDTSERMA